MQAANSQSRGTHDRPFQQSLRARIALGVALPVLLVLSSLSLTHYNNERRLLEDQMQLTALQLGELMLSSLRHAMLVNDQERIDQVLADVGRMQSVRGVEIINLDGIVKAASSSQDVGGVRQRADRGCSECHALPKRAMPRTVRLSSGAGLLRIATPIGNEPACASCHPQAQAHLGMLLIDVSMVEIEQHVLNNLGLDLAISALGTLLVTLGMYLLIHRVVVRRVEAFRRPLAEFASGDFATRLPEPSAPADELGDLAAAFNQMADKLERHAREQELLSDLRQRAIVEERDRIARELHDGLAQVLGYVNTKAIAVRLLLSKGQQPAAQEQLSQLEEAARGLFVDVREAILGLKAAGQTGQGLTAGLQDFAAQFSRLSGLEVEMQVQPGMERLALPAETELQLMRIVQEALANVRKHASASRARVSLRREDGAFELRVADDGVGFDPTRDEDGGRSHYGLATMRERAEAIGAAFAVSSAAGSGTCVSVRLPLPEA